MPEILLDQKKYTCRENETVLESLLRYGVNAPFSCRNGVCHVCLLRCSKGDIPEEAQQGLRSDLISKGYFKPCKCRPEYDMEVGFAKPEDMLIRAIVYKKELLSANVCRILFEPTTQVSYRAGQFINVVRDDGLTRSYSLASVPVEDYYMEIHVKLVLDGDMSRWIFKNLGENDELKFYGPQGSCFYRPEYCDKDLLLISTGTGLSPHIGIVREALQNNHQGKIYLYHGGRETADHYLKNILQITHQDYANFYYTLCVTGGSVENGVARGRANIIAFSEQDITKDWRVFLSGNPDMVESALSESLDQAVENENIHTDPFVHAGKDAKEHCDKDNQEHQSVRKEKRKYPDPDPEMWSALGEGVLLNKILKEFYGRVFEDPKLSPYFMNVTRQRLVEKVYNFLYQVFTGEKVYFGDRPRNAHHWMVISDELFDYREKMMESCLKKYGLPQHLILRWLTIEGMYRSDIVKSVPWKKKIFGMEMPLDGFEETRIDASTLCDSCQGEINVGDMVRYHVRMGTTYCEKCKDGL